MATKKVGRPVVKGLEKKITRTCSITPTIEKKAIKFYGNLGKAIEFAVAEKIILKPQT